MKRALLWVFALAAAVAPIGALAVQHRDTQQADAAMRDALDALSANLDVAPTPERLDAARAARGFDRARGAGGDESRARLATALWHVARGYGDLGRGELVLASQSAATALREAPDNPHAKLFAGVVALRRGDAGRAESLLAAVHQDASAPASVRLRAGIHHLDVLLDARRGHPALALAEELARAYADEPAVLNRLGLARLSVGDLDGATAALRRAAERAPEDPSPRINLAEVARQRGDLPVARAHLERAIALREGDGEAWLAYGIVLAAQGGDHRVAARTAILRTARLLPDNAGPWVAQGNLDLEESHWAEAATSFREALQRDAHQVTARTNLGVALARAGDRRGALVAFTEATQRAPNAGEAWNGLGAMHLAAGELLAAVDPLQRAMVLLPDDANPAMNLGVVMERMERWDEAARAYREALRRAPGHPQATERLGRLQPATRRGVTRAARPAASE